ncbi:MAG TPA: carboxypeptidase regulatory-like domain-containing protein [Acidobacteriaceae bacterium]|nr:carboxypeptidase regulatory-like domain-containing protein [Acidobacteriaceae bacterium]
MHLLRQPLSMMLWLLLAAFAVQTAAAQTFSASIAGTVTDSSGAVVSGAVLQLQNVATNDVREQKSAGDGNFAFAGLLPGTYKISATASGFESYLRTSLILVANTAATVNIQLKVGATQQKVVVSASTVLVDTESATNSVTIDEALLEALPNNTLQPLNFIFDLAGTTEGQGGMTTRSGFLDQNASMFGINGGRTGESEILIDGAPSTAIDWGGLIVSPINDSVQEQQVIDNVYDAQYERGGEGVVTMVTKSGGQNYHGEVYDFMRNDGLDANSWSGNNSGSPRGKFHRNQYGANAGGPLWRKHNLFFFGAYEGLRQPETDNSGLQTMPTTAEVGGDFSHTYLPDGQLDVIYNPFSSRLVTASDGSQYYTRDPYPNNMITTGFDTVGKKIAALYPAPNHNSGLVNDQNNFVKQGGGDTSDDKFDIRVDWAQSEKHRLFVRVSDRARQDNTPACFLCNGGDEGYATQDHGEQGVINDTITPNAKWLVNLYGAYSRWFEGQTLLGFGQSSSAIGLNPSLFQVNTLPLVNVAGYYTLGNQYSTFDRYIRYNSTAIASVSRQFSAHTLRFGFNYDIAMINNREDQPGVFNFDQGLTSCDPGPTPADPCKASLQSSTSGNGMASLLVGTGSGGDSTISMDPAFSQHSYGMYVQDEWRATRRLTVNAGLRYENQRPATERYNRIAYFDLNAVNPLSTAFGSTLKGAFEYAGVGGRGRGAWLPDNVNFGPRLGLAYRFTDKLAGRVGSGIFYGPASAMLSFDGGGQSPGYTAQTNWIATNNGGYTPQNLVSNPFPQGIQQPTGNSLGAMTYVGYGTGQLWPKIPHPIGTLYQWSTDLQYQVSSHSVAEIGYTGVRGRKLLFGNPNLDLDQLPDTDLSLGTQLDQLVNNPYAAVITDPNSYLSQSQLPYNELLRPYPEYTYLQQTRSLPGARSQFDALTAKYTWSFSSGLSSITSYQWSKNLDDGSEALIGWAIGNMWRDANDPKLDYAISTHDVPQSFAEAFLYQLPYGHGRQFGATSPGAVNQALGGWNLSGAVRLTSGLPFWQPVNYGWNPLGNYGFPGNALPNMIGDPRRNRSAYHWINVRAFQGVSSSGSGAKVACGNANDQCQPFSYNLGDEPQRMSTIREAETKNLDLGIGKVFGTERIHAELRADFLNAFNHPIYGGSWNIEENLYASDFGQVYGTRNDPRNIQVSLKLSY